MAVESTKVAVERLNSNGLTDPDEFLARLRGAADDRDFLDLYLPHDAGNPQSAIQVPHPQSAIDAEADATKKKELVAENTKHKKHVRKAYTIFCCSGLMALL